MSVKFSQKNYGEGETSNKNANKQFFLRQTTNLIDIKDGTDGNILNIPSGIEQET